MKKIILIISLFLTFSSVLEAKYVQTCEVKYLSSDGWSDYYTVDVTFMTGSELNEATSSIDYSSLSTYGIVFWGDGKATIIEISSIVFCGNKATKSCITSHALNIEGESQDGRSWEICTKNYCY